MAPFAGWLIAVSGCWSASDTTGGAPDLQDEAAVEMNPQAQAESPARCPPEQAPSPFCDESSAIQGWQSLVSYVLSTREFYDQAGNLLDSRFDYDLGNTDWVGYFDPSTIPGISFTWTPPQGTVHERSYNIAVVDMIHPANSASEVIVEIDYLDFHGTAVDFDIKELPVELASFTAGTAIQWRKVIEEAPTVATLNMDGTTGAFCPLNRTTARFALSQLPVNDRARYLFALVPRPGRTDPADLTAPTARFRVNTVSVQTCSVPSGSCVVPTTPEQPSGATNDNCIAYECGALDVCALDVCVPQGTRLSFRAVPQHYVNKTVFIQDKLRPKLAPNLNIRRFTLNSARVVFSDGRTIELPDACRFVAVEDTVGAAWAELRASGTFQVFLANGRLVDMQVGETVVSRWTWMVGAAPLAVLARKAASLANIVPLESPFYEDDSGRSPSFLISASPGRTFDVELSTRLRLLAFPLSPFIQPRTPFIQLSRNNGNYFSSRLGGASVRDRVAPPLVTPTAPAAFVYQVPPAAWRALEPGAAVYFRISLRPSGTAGSYQSPIGVLPVVYAPSPYRVTSLVGDQDELEPGGPLDTPPISKRLHAALLEVAGPVPPAKLDEAGRNRPVALTHSFATFPSVDISHASLRIVFSGEEVFKNDMIFFGPPWTPSAYEPVQVIVLRDLLGEEPKAGHLYEIKIDLLHLPVRLLRSWDDLPGAGVSWVDRSHADEDDLATVDAVSELRNGQLDLVFSDDVRLNFSELTIDYGAP